MKAARPVQVRVYDLGGYGDVAAAARMASHLAHNGHDVSLVPSHPQVSYKLNVLKPDVPVRAYRLGAIIVDGYGSHLNTITQDRPHIFFGDYGFDRKPKSSVPIYVRAGLWTVQSTNDEPEQPMFFRPYREWDILKPKDIDVKKFVMDSMFSVDQNSRKMIEAKSSLEGILDQSGRIAFAHFHPGITATEFFNRPYVRLLEYAAQHFETGFLLGLFLDDKTKTEIAKEAYERNYTVVDNTGLVVAGLGDKPTLLFLGPQSQSTVTQLLMSSTMPNIVTGDKTLSDAAYGLITINGQGFFYDCPEWLEPTMKALKDAIGRVSPFVAGVFEAGSTQPRTNPLQYIDHQDFAVNVLGNPKLSEFYRKQLKEAMQKEIEARFGTSALKKRKGANGFHIPNGAPFLVQDVVEDEIKRLQEDPIRFKKIEEIRTGTRAF